MQKYSIYTLVLVLLLTAGLPYRSEAQGQLDADRTTATKIADLLNKLPTSVPEDYESAMQSMADLGTEGLSQMASMLRIDGDNTKLEYALAGFAFYASQPENERMARMAVQGYGNALDKITDPEAKNFILTQYKWIGKEDATPYLEAFLHDQRLSGTASRALATIGSESAERALILALTTTENDELKPNFIEALGDFNSPNAVNELTPYLESSDPAIKKVTIYALANIADPSSDKDLRKEAEKANFTYETNNATSTYLHYINNLGEKGNTKKALKSLRWLDKRTNVTDHYQTKAGILNLTARFSPGKSNDLLMEAANSEEYRFRGAALSYAKDEEILTNLSDWSNTLASASPDAQSAIIGRLGKIESDKVTEILKPYLENENQNTRFAAIEAVVTSGGNLALPELLDRLDGAGEEELALLKRYMLSIPGEDIMETIAGKIPSSNPKSKVILLEILASRAAEDQIDVVLETVNDAEANVKNAALTALSSMATPEDLNSLVTLLKKESHPADLEKIQEALMVANALRNNQEAQTQWALTLMPQLSQEKQAYLYKVLATTGGAKALNSLSEIYEAGNSSQKLEVVKALNQTEDVNAAEVLLQMGRSSDNQNIKEEALQGYLRLIAATDGKAESKVIMLRNILELTNNNEAVNAVLRRLGGYPTFQGLVVAGAHLDNPTFQQSAARAVMGIVLNNEQLHGQVVREIVQKTKNVISGQDSQYYKTSLQKYLDEMPEEKGFYALFNGKNLDGWKGVYADPVKRAEMTEGVRAREQSKANETMAKGWTVEDGLLIFTGEGQNIATEKDFKDFEMFVDWKITADGDAGIYLRGTPQVQIWDTARTDVGAEVGSGGLYNNATHLSKPIQVADNPVGEWNTFHIIMRGEKVTVYLNGKLVVDKVTLENYWNREIPIFKEGQIELQAHGTYVAYRDIYIKELDMVQNFELSEEEKEEGFEVLFDGSNMDQWIGNTTDYVIEDGIMAIYPDRGGQGNLFTKKEYDDFEFRFEFKLTPGANNGLGIRAPLEGDAAYVGMELQILDDTAEIYSELKPYQYHGSLYGVAAAKKGHQKPIGEWNYQEVRVKGNQVEVILNGTKILDVDISEAKDKGTLDGREHPGLFKDTGHVGFLGHGDVVYFRNIRIKEL